MYVILDWVANHTGWDHKWITEHPEYYQKNAKGEVTDPLNPETGKSWGWTDVAHFGLRQQRTSQSHGKRNVILDKRRKYRRFPL